jgi:hypothetical protein
MMTVDPGWSLHALLRTFQPHESWRSSFGAAYTQAMESPDPEEQLRGFRTAAMILGDMNACLLCLFVCLHGLRLDPSATSSFWAHRDLCLWSMGLAVPRDPAGGAVRIADIGKPEAFHRDDAALDAWMREQLQPFEGDDARAAQFAMRLAAVRLGLLQGPEEASIAQLLDGSLWQRAFDTLAR